MLAHRDVGEECVRIRRHGVQLDSFFQQVARLRMRLRTQHPSVAAGAQNTVVGIELVLLLGHRALQGDVLDLRRALPQWCASPRPAGQTDSTISRS